MLRRPWLVVAITGLAVSSFGCSLLGKGGALDDQHCNEEKAKRVGDELAKALHLGSPKADVQRFIAGHSWQISEAQTAGSIVAGDLTYCGAGSSLTFDVTFDFADGQHLSAYRVETIHGTHVVVPAPK